MAGEESNRKAPGVVTEMEMRRRKLEYDTNRLAIQNAEYELAVAEMNALAKEKELRAAEYLRKRVQLRSPINGIVTEKKSHVGEYVRSGDPVVRVGQLDRLRVEGRVSAADLKPKIAINREVVVRVSVGVDPTTGEESYESFRGRIEHVGAEIDMDKKYRVWTEIDNRDGYVVRPGMIAEMTILN
jgi:multidrug efflux pump subunit AcrA (membrane-fusion protein)